MYQTDEKSLKRDTRIRFFASASGPGGQNVNKVASGVRLHHIPSGIMVKASKERFQSQNRKIAFERLKQRLEALNRPRKQRKMSLKPLPETQERRLKEKRLLSKKKHLRRFLLEAYSEG